VNIAYNDSYQSGITYVLPNGNTFTVEYDREVPRKHLVTNRRYRYGNQQMYSYATEYDLLERPTNATDSLSTAREWLYNNRNELASAVIGTNSYSYAYDSIGNRNWAALNSATNTYVANSLNQYSQVDASQFVYDADGNLTQDGRCNYTYDAENRLVSVVPIAPTEGSLSIHNRYDHKGLRIRKIVKRYANGWWSNHATHTFIFDGGNIVLERIAKADGNHITKEYFWGIDKSGSEQGAGGVGGLLAVSVNGIFSIPCYDHNGNIVTYISETGGIEALYVYDAYGNTIEKSGEKANIHSFGFSTKYHDREVGLIGYQKRFYSPDHGRWLNRDPIEEEGGENLYAFCLNSPQYHMDINVLSTCCRNGRKISCDTTYKWEGSVTTASATWLLGATFVMVDLVSNFICSSCTRYRLHAKAVLPTISYGAPISITGSNVKFGNYPPESFVGSVSLISAGFGAMGVVEAARLSIGNATSSSFGLVGGAEIGISAGYGWFVDFELTEE
jgi:RHS repeat-associated protein